MLLLGHYSSVETVDPGAGNLPHSTALAVGFMGKLGANLLRDRPRFPNLLNQPPAVDIGWGKDARELTAIGQVAD